MFTVQRIYAFHTLPGRACAVWVDRLYPRGIAKENMRHVIRLNDLTPSSALRRWYHEAPQARYGEFSVRYLAELQEPAAQQALSELRRLAEQYAEVRLLTAVKSPKQSHVAVLLHYLGEPFIEADNSV